MDLGSKNGTLVNARRIEGRVALRAGDVITLGDHKIGIGASAAEERDDVEAIGTRVFSAKAIKDSLAQQPQSADDLQRKNRVLAALSGASAALLSHRPLGETFEQILALIFAAVPAERGAIAMFEGGTDPSTAVPVIKASRARKGEPIQKVSRSISRRVLRERVSILLPNVLEDALLQSEQSIVTTGIRSALCAPLWNTEEGRDAVIGVVYLDSRERTHTFSEDDLELVTALAGIAAAKIENVRLVEESLEKRRLEDDMRVAAEIQRSLLPKAAPNVPGYQVIGSSEPCRAVGGDYFDFSWDGGRLVFALGDVAGKGTGAALIMTVLRAAVRDLWREGDLASAVAAINTMVQENVPPNKYVTFFMGRLDPATGAIDYVNAGHNAPVICRPDGAAERLETGGMVLGLFEGAEYEQGQARLNPGDGLVVFTDGFSETWNPAGEELGEEGLVALIRRSPGLPATAIRQSLYEGLAAFSKGEKATDDRTLIVISRAA
jgi:serine phosphatase RsbU (regulator of sigma subunit)